MFRIEWDGSVLTWVYMYDPNDLDDVRRVLVGLRVLGFNGRPSYKADPDRWLCKYGRTSPIYVAQPDSLDFDDRRVVS